MNYGLCRILISTIDAPYLFQLIPGATDSYWDLTTIRYYQRYVQENIFDPVGVTSAFPTPTDHALAYPFPANVPGWDSGELSTMSGCRRLASVGRRSARGHGGLSAVASSSIPPGHKPCSIAVRPRREGQGHACSGASTRRVASGAPDKAAASSSRATYSSCPGAWNW